MLFSLYHMTSFLNHIDHGRYSVFIPLCIWHFLLCKFSNELKKVHHTLSLYFNPYFNLCVSSLLPLFQDLNSHDSSTIQGQPVSWKMTHVTNSLVSFGEMPLAQCSDLQNLYDYILTDIQISIKKRTEWTNLNKYFYQFYLCMCFHRKQTCILHCSIETKN